MDDLDGPLAAAAQAGSHDAFARLVQRHQQAVRAFARRTCGDWALADDIAQEAFLTAWTRIGTLKDGQSVRAWITGIAYRKALTRMRSERRGRARDAVVGQARATAADRIDETRLALEQAMAALSLDQRACVALCLAGDYTHPEAAEILGLPLGTVKSHVTRGREALRVVLGGGDE